MSKHVARLVTITALLTMVSGGLMAKGTEPAEPTIVCERSGTMQQTIKNVKAFLFANNNQAYTMEEIVAAIEHHYTTDDRAQQTLSVWIDAGLIQGIVSTADRSGMITRYYLDWAKRTGGHR